MTIKEFADNVAHSGKVGVMADMHLNADGDTVGPRFSSLLQYIHCIVICISIQSHVFSDLLRIIHSELEVGILHTLNQHISIEPESSKHQKLACGK